MLTNWYETACPKGDPSSSSPRLIFHDFSSRVLLPWLQGRGCTARCSNTCQAALEIQWMIEVDSTVMNFIEKHLTIGNPNSCKPAFVTHSPQYWIGYVCNAHMGIEDAVVRQLTGLGSPDCWSNIKKTHAYWFHGPWSYPMWLSSKS